MMNSQIFFLTLIIIMWDSSRISKKWGFSTDKLMLGTARKHKRKFSLFLDIMKCRQEHKSTRQRFSCTFGIDMIFNVPLRAWGFLQIWTTGHLHLFPAPEQKQKHALSDFLRTKSICNEKGR